MKRLEKFLYCLDLELGALIVAWFMMALNVFTIIGLPIAISKLLHFEGGRIALIIVINLALCGARIYGCWKLLSAVRLVSSI